MAGGGAMSRWLALIGRTIGAARFIERQAEPRIRRAVKEKLNEMAQVADDTEEQLTNGFHEAVSRVGARSRGVGMRREGKGPRAG